LPETFDTPMFWTDEELAELKGTETLPRIGKESAEERYTSILLPVITSHLDLFDISKCDLTAFHRMGSLVMAYSFGRDSEDDDDNSEEEEKNDIAMVPLADILNADPRLNNVSKS
jgi:N-lysine methyltransferase SETD6